MLDSRAIPWIAAISVAAAAAVGIPLLASDSNGADDEARAAAGGWRTLAPSPLARSEVGAARVGNFIYVAGGFEAPLNTTDEVVRYDIRANSWSGVAPMPVGVNHPGVAAHRGFLFVHGGYTATADLAAETGALQRYDPRTNTWAQLRPSPSERGAHALVPFKGKLYAIGGVDGGEVLASTQIYDLKSNSWRAGPGMDVAREHIAAAVVGKSIFALGGRLAGENLAAAERLDTKRMKWFPLPNLRVPRSGFGAATVSKRVIAVGGEELKSGGSTIAPVEIFDPAKRRWRLLARMPTPGTGTASSPSSAACSRSRAARSPAAPSPASSRRSESRSGSCPSSP